MRRSTVSTRAAALAALLLTTTSVAACGSDEEPDTSGDPATPAPAASAFPEPKGSLDDLLAQTTAGGDIVASPAGAVFAPSPRPQRFGFGMFSVDGSQITDADVAVYAQHESEGKVHGPFPARVESLETDPAFVAKTTADDPQSAKVVYVTNLRMDEPGEWQLAAVMRAGDDFVSTRMPSVVASERPQIPDPGEPAPAVHTPTLEEVGADVESIDTRVPPSTMHGDDLADVLGEEPVVLLFATPALCVSRVCGPVVDVAEQVKDEYGDEAAFIHMEIYEDNVPDPKNLRSQVEAFGLPTEPWLFVIDEDGNVTTRIEGAFSVAELERAVEEVVG